MPLSPPRPVVPPRPEERLLLADELIVSKTDLHGRITYANETFRRISGYTRAELLGAPHSLIRHPDMPRCVFQLLWDELHAEREVFAFVKNLAKDGAFYWVFAHVTPSYDASGRVIGYHSNRRAPARSAIAALEPVYAKLSAVEQAEHDVKSALAASSRALRETLAAAGKSYGELIFSLLEDEAEVAHGARDR